jgi:glycosyltransferase involved in cell wall biosynthesis
MTDAQAVRIARTQDIATANAPLEERWLFVDGARTFGGHEAMLLRWLEELHVQGSISAVLVAAEGSRLAEEAAPYARVIPLPSNGMGRIGGALRDGIAFARAALRTRAQLCVVAEGCLLDQPIFAFVARLLGLKVVEYVPLVQTSTSMHFRSGPWRDAFVRHVYRRFVHGWITITREQAEDFRRWSGVRGPIFTLPNTVARSIETADLQTRAQQGTAGRLRVLVLGRIEAHQKGLDALLDYVSAHPEWGDRLRLTFVGSGPYESVIAARLREDRKLAGWVELQGWSAPMEALAAHDVLLMTSRYEGVPLVMLEAMALGVPVVAPALDGIRAFLDPESLYPKGDLQAAFDRIDRLRAQELRATIARRNRGRFERCASNAAFGDAVRGLTQQLRGIGAPRERGV